MIERGKYVDLGVTRISRCYCLQVDGQNEPSLLIVLNASGSEVSPAKKLFHVIEEDPHDIGKYYLLDQEQIKEKFGVDLSKDTDESIILKRLLTYDQESFDIISVSCSQYTKVLHVNEEDFIEILAKTSNAAIDVDYITAKVNFVNLMSKEFGLVILRKI